MAANLQSLLQLLIVSQCGFLLLFLVTRQGTRPAIRLSLIGLIGNLGLHMAINLVAAQSNLALVDIRHFCSFLYGPFFYLYARALIIADEPLRLRTFSFVGWLIIPSLYHLFPGFPIQVLAVSIFAVMALYLALTVRLLTRFRSYLKAHRSDDTPFLLDWLRRLIYLFCGIFVLDVSQFLLSRIWGWHQSEWLGTLLFGTLLAFVNLLVFKGLSFPQIFTGISAGEWQVNLQPEGENISQDNQWEQRINDHMRTLQPFLKPDLTLAELAEQLGLSARNLSHILNARFQQNFSDFINSWRVELAKRYFSDPEHQGQNISEIMYAVGFNSKSVFNATFKRKTGLTPSAYRQKFPVRISEKSS
ncbi:MAG: helix-turn-helix transcriptional regulator [Acidobacteria bacterium]|nr:helix-turn-helix transcriptional regulator [Acidobacteriota bacterium]MCB9399196.1 helix-turn-helix transcriptional regulator [Acidobacteriota bacterium]